ncbi:MAG: hypothetical protein RBT64_02540 [Trichloromonas sp.]|nr:hypothetical protein [Trichloromonas sp.]
MQKCWLGDNKVPPRADFTSFFVQATNRDKQYSGQQLRESAEKIKRTISDIIECADKKIDAAVHREFVKAVHRPIRPGKTDGLGRVDYLCLNYDTLLEDALALERISFSDGLDGGVTGWWNPTVFERDGLVADLQIARFRIFTARRTLTSVFTHRDSVLSPTPQSPYAGTGGKIFPITAIHCGDSRLIRDEDPPWGRTIFSYPGHSTGSSIREWRCLAQMLLINPYKC